MKQLFTIILLLTCLSKFVFGQTNGIEYKIDSLGSLKEQPFACNSYFWKVVSIGKDAIPFLISRLDDTTSTQISLTCKKTNVRFGDICFLALNEIFNIPLYYVTQQQFDFIDQFGCQQGLFIYLENNRHKFKSQIIEYYNKFKSEIKFIQYSSDYQNDCKKENKIYGYYDINWALLDKK